MSSEMGVDQLTLLPNRKEEVSAKLPSVCRTCLRGECDIDMLDNELYQIDEIFLEESEITTQIQSFDEVLCLFVDNEIGKQSDMTPKSICLACVEKARLAFHFIEMCRQTDALLKECLQEMKSVPSEVTATDTMDDEVCVVEELSKEGLLEIKSAPNEVNHTAALLEECLQEMKSVPSEVTATDTMDDEVCVVEELSKECLLEIKSAPNDVNQTDALLEESLQEKKSVLSEVTATDTMDDEVCVVEELSQECLLEIKSAPNEVNATDTMDAEVCVVEERLRELKPASCEVTATDAMDDEVCAEEELSYEHHHEAVQQTNTNSLVTEDMESLLIETKAPKEKKTRDRGKSSRPHKCDICQKSFTLLKSLKQHNKMHTEPGTSCSYCNRTFHRTNDWSRHIRIHEKNFPYPCSKCSRAFKQAFELEEHQVSAHPPEVPKSFYCNYCDKTFNKSNTFYLHMKKHRGEFNHPCSYCDKHFISSGALKSHQIHAHTREVNAVLFSCGIDNCRRAFVTKSALRVHWKTKHNTSDVQPPKNLGPVL